MHVFGQGLESLSMAQLDALEDWHYRQVGILSAAKLVKHRQLKELELQEAIILAQEISAHTLRNS